MRQEGQLREDRNHRDVQFVRMLAHVPDVSKENPQERAFIKHFIGNAAITRLQFHAGDRREWSRHNPIVLVQTHRLDRPMKVRCLQNPIFVVTIRILDVFLVARANAVADYLSRQQQEETEMGNLRMTLPD